MSSKFIKTDALAAKFLPKTGKGKHWAYKHVNTLSIAEKKEADKYWKVFLSEFTKK